MAIKIKKEDFLKLNEANVLFITNPGRMGDEDGITFIIKNHNRFIIYRIDGLMYPLKEERISLTDIEKQFPKWRETWKNANNKEYQGKYKYIYMGFGNGLSIDNTIYSNYLPYLNDLVEKNLKDKTLEEKETLKYATIYNNWEQAFLNMINDKGYLLNN